MLCEALQKKRKNLKQSTQGALTTNTKRFCSEATKTIFEAQGPFWSPANKQHCPAQRVVQCDRGLSVFYLPKPRRQAVPVTAEVTAQGVAGSEGSFLCFFPHVLVCFVVLCSGRRLEELVHTGLA